MDADGNKTGGRQKGTPNKRTQDLLDLAEEMEADPFLFLCKVMKGDLRDFGYAFPEDEIHNPEEEAELHPEDKGRNLSFDKTVGVMLPKHMIPLEMRIDAAKELMPYLHAKRKSVELKVDEKSTGKVITLAYSIPEKPK